MQKQSRVNNSHEKSQIGIAYNLWDNIELLPFSIKPIREHVRYVCVIYQKKSNWGNKLNQTADLELYRRFGLIDEYFLYEPDMSLTPKENEMIKRNIGLDKCRKAGCTIHSTMDADEIYKEGEYKRAIEVFGKANYDSSACKILTYYGDSSHILDPPEEYYVPLFYKINEREFDVVAPELHADPSRKMVMGNLLLFGRDCIQMHHLSYVRRDIRQKLENMSASVNWRDQIDKFVDAHEKWKGGKCNTPAGEYDTKKVKSII